MSAFSLGPLAAGVVDARLALQQELRHGDDGVALRPEGVQDPRQGFRRVDRRVVEEDDAPRADVFQHPLTDLLGGDALPVQTVAIPYNGNC